MRSTLGRIGIVTLAVLLLTSLPAWAQTTSAGEPQTMLKIVQRGIEVPTYFIFAGSIVAIALIIEHFLVVRWAAVAPAQQLRKAKEQIEARNFRECLDKLKKSQTFFARVMAAALQHARHGFDAMHEAALEKSAQLSGRMFRKAEYLNVIGNLGPLLGLLGTVWGMIQAFASLGAGGGQADAGRLADGISLALVNTLLGLALAILGIGFYGVCRSRIESLTVAATVEVLDLVEYFRPAPAPGSLRPSAPSVPKAAPAPAAAPRPATDAPNPG